MSSYSIKVLEVAQKEGLPTDFSFDGIFLPGETMYNPFVMTLVQEEGLNILVDSGLDMAVPRKAGLLEAMGGYNGHSNAEILETVGLTPEDIHAVILTHLHADHAGGILSYPNARFYVQRKELMGWVETSLNPEFETLWMMSMDLEDLTDLMGVAREGRVTFLDGDCANLFPGIDILGFEMEHSFASQCVLVRTDKDGKEQVFAIAGDLGNRPENYTGGGEVPCFIPNPKFAVGSRYNIIKAMSSISRAVGGNIDSVISNHDGTLRERLPSHTSKLGLCVTEVC